MFVEKMRALTVATKLNREITNLTDMMLDALMKDDKEYIENLDSAIKHLKNAVKEIEQGCGILEND